jgi:chaperonin GroES
MSSLKPLYDQIVVERSESDEKTAGGIVLPDKAKEKPRQGKVLAVGKGKVLQNGDVKPLEVREGDRVLFGSYAGTEVKLAGKEYLILKENDVLAVLN